MKNATEIAIIIDKSGSMYSKANDVIGGFNSFLEEQHKLPGEANISVTFFDTEVIRPIESVSLQNCKKLGTKNDNETIKYTPDGCTALLDAIGSTVTKLGERLAKLPEDQRPNKVIAVIITDGLENSSKEYTRDQIKQMIEHQQEKYSWQFMYLGANVDAFAEAGGLGISLQNVSGYTASNIGTRSAYAGVSHAISNYRSKNRIGSNWKKDIQ